MQLLSIDQNLGLIKECAYIFIRTKNKSVMAKVVRNNGYHFNLVYLNDKFGTRYRWSYFLAAEREFDAYLLETEEDFTLAKLSCC